MITWREAAKAVIEKTLCLVPVPTAIAMGCGPRKEIKLAKGGLIEELKDDRLLLQIYHCGDLSNAKTSHQNLFKMLFPAVM